MHYNKIIKQCHPDRLPNHPGQISIRNRKSRMHLIGIKGNTFLKPVLLFGDAIEWIGDITKSINNDKDFHAWGQSESCINKRPYNSKFDIFISLKYSKLAANI